MEEIEKLVLQKLFAELRLEKAKVEFGNDYVFGFDDVQRIISNEIIKLQ